MIGSCEPTFFGDGCLLTAHVPGGKGLVTAATTTTDLIMRTMWFNNRGGRRQHGSSLAMVPLVDISNYDCMCHKCQMVSGGQDVIKKSQTITDAEHKHVKEPSSPGTEFCFGVFGSIVSGDCVFWD